MMATDRVAKILKSSGVFSDEEIQRMTEDDAWDWIHTNNPLPRSADSESSETDHSDRH
jgi:hypothetical protein